MREEEITITSSLVGCNHRRMTPWAPARENEGRPAGGGAGRLYRLAEATQDRLPETRQPWETR